MKLEITQYQKPGQTGVIRGEPNAVYHANPAISNSDLALFISDPKRFESIRKGEIEREHKAAFDLGSLFHVLSLEGIEEYHENFVHEAIVPPKPTKAQIEAFEKFRDLDKPTKAQVEAHTRQGALIEAHDLFWRVHEGKHIAKADDDQAARAMRDSLFADTDAMELLSGWDEAHRELTMRTQETSLGFSVQVKFDYLHPSGLAVDLKSVRSLDVFRRSFADFGYYRQAAFYCMVCELVTGTFPDFHFIAVESSPPYEVAVFRPTPESIETGQDEIEAALKLLSRCLASGEFPKRFSGVHSIGLGRFEIERSERRIERMKRAEGIEKTALTDSEGEA